MVDFTDVLSKRSEEIQKPKPKPVGTYLAIIQGMPKQKLVTPKDGGDQMPVLTYSLKMIAPQADVDQEKLQDVPPVQEWAPMFLDFFVHNEAGEYAHSQWLENTVGVETGDKTVGQRVAETSGKQILAKLKHRPFINRQNEADIQTEIESTAHV